jgi:IclR family transcriptional regulator, acetate operon repressor
MKAGDAGRVPAPTRVASVARAARLLELVAEMPEAERTAARFARALGKPLPTVYHLLKTLVDARLLARDGNGCYHLGSAVGVLAEAYHRQSVPHPALLAGLTTLAAETAESAYLCGWRHGGICILAAREGTRAVRVADLQTGYFGQGHARASGKVLLAFAAEEDRLAYLAGHPLHPVTPATITDPERFAAELATVRLQGYATDVGELAEGVACLAVPVLVRDRLVAGYAVAAPQGRFQQNFVPYLDSASRAASAAAARLRQEAPEPAAPRPKSRRATPAAPAGTAPGGTGGT